jgi:DNA-binding CsgD family transcriptional regulator/tetratricopeptide (TPR) repeat protein
MQARSRHTPLVGRGQELAFLQERLQAAARGVGGVVMIAGEPGIGKTRLLDELEQQARSSGWLVLSGRAYETEAATPYRPFIEALRGVNRRRIHADSRGDSEDGARWLSRNAPHEHNVLGDLSLSISPASRDERYELFAGVAEFLCMLAPSMNAVASLVILDDLHWADRASLLLLQHLARWLAVEPVLVAGAYRTVNLEANVPLCTLLADLERDETGQGLVLAPLTSDETRTLVLHLSGDQPAGAVADRIHRLTHGNPFFVTQVVRHLQRHAQDLGDPRVAGTPWETPHGVHTVLEWRLAQLHPTTRKLLETAAVIGEQFSPDVLAVAGGLDDDALDRSAVEAIRSGFIRGQEDGYCFSHALVRQALYEAVGLPRRRHLHRRVALAIEQVESGNLAPHAAMLAGHYRLAGSLFETTALLHWTRQAADAALRVFAWEEAVQHLEAVLALLKPDEAPETCHALLMLGNARRKAGDVHGAMAAFHQAAAIARKRTLAEELALAALGHEEAALDAGTPRLSAGDPSICLLEEALESQALMDGALRARLLAALAGALFFAGARGRAEAVCRDAIALAREAGDSSILARALSAWRAIIWGPDNLDERLSLSVELISLSERVDDVDIILAGYQWRITVLLEIGLRQEAAESISSFERRIHGLRLPALLFYAPLFRALDAILDGRLDEAERLANEALALGRRVQSDNALMLAWVQVWLVRREQGTFDDIETAVADLIQRFPTIPGWPCIQAAIYCEQGRLAEARAVFDRIAARDFAELPRDHLWLANLANLAEPCARLGDVERADILYRLLLPYAQRYIVASGISCWGSASHYLGILAATRGDKQTAAQHLDDAIRMNEQLNAPVFAASSRLAYAEVLLNMVKDAGSALPSEERTAMLDRSRSLLAQVQRCATRFGLDRLADRAESLTCTLSDLTRSGASTNRAPPRSPGDLTARETDVLLLIAAGLTTREVAAKLVVTVPTVERHITNLYAKIGARNRADAAAYALRHTMPIGRDIGGPGVQ